MANVYVALLHYPVYNKHRDVIATSVSNYDIHDIARTAHCYRVLRYYIINPLPSQRALTRRIASHWVVGYGATFNPIRKEAIECLEIEPSLRRTMEDIEQREHRQPRLVVTSRRFRHQTTTYEVMRETLAASNDPFLILFGTGWGLTDDIVAQADYSLEPIMKDADYNHLPVRGATAIILDRLLGDRSNGGSDNAGNNGNRKG